MALRRRPAGEASNRPRARRIRYIADQLPTRSGGGEIAIDQVWDRAGRQVGLGEAVPPWPGLAGLPAQVTHDRADQLAAARDTPVGQVRV